MKPSKHSRRKQCAVSLLSAACCFSALGGIFTAANAAAESSADANRISLTEDLTKVTSLADLENTSLKYYGAIDWAGYGRIALNESNRANFHNAYVNGVKLGDNSDFKNTNLSADGVHHVGLLSEANSCRIFSVEYTAQANGYVTLTGGSLSVTSEGDLWNPSVSYNAKLAMSFTKNDADNKITPNTAGWEYYNAGNSYTIADQTVQVAAGDKLYLNFRAARVDDSVLHCYVGFTYSPSFVFSAEDPNAQPQEPIDYDNVSLIADVARVKSLADLENNTALEYYTGNSWAGYSRNRITEAKKAEHPQVLINNVVVNNASDLELVHLRASGLHTVGVWNENVNRVVSVAYTAKKSGYVWIPETTLVMQSSEGGVGKSHNGKLGVSVRVNGEAAKPTDADWTYYEAGQTYTVPAKSLQVNEGDKVYMNFYSSRIDDSENLTYVSFEYKPEFKYSETDPLAPATVHAFTHVAKLTKNDKGELINAVKITDDDDTTYPFSYLYRTTGGSAAGFTGQEDAAGVAEMSPNASLGKNNIYAAGSYSGFVADSGAIVTVANIPDPNNVILGFTSPYDGKLSISNISFYYLVYPNATNGYTFYGNQIGAAFKGYQFRVLLNGKQVYPASGWDASMAKTYEADKDGFAAGDLIASQRTNDIENIYVRKYDKVYFEVTRADLSADAVQNCDVIKFNPVFSVDTDADMSNYVSYTTAGEYFNAVENTNDGDEILTYRYVNTEKGLYNKAVSALMSVDYSANAYGSGILDDKPAEIGMNYFKPTAGRNTMLVYKAAAKGNLTISAESLYRGGKLTLWQYYDLLKGGNVPKDSDGVRMRIEINGKRVYPADAAWKTYMPDENNKGVFDFKDIVLGVNEGDAVSIRFDCGANDSYDGVNFNPIFALKETDTPAENPAITVEDPIDQDVVPSPDPEPSPDPDPTPTPDNGEEKESGCGKGCNATVSGAACGLIAALSAACVVISKKRRK